MVIGCCFSVLVISTHTSPTSLATSPQHKLHDVSLVAGGDMSYVPTFNITTYLICTHTTHTKHTQAYRHTHIPHVVLPLRPHHNIHVHVPYAHMSHHLHLMLLYSPQHLLPTSSALHHDDLSNWPHTMELYCSGNGVKEQTKSNIQILIITSMYMYGNMQWRTG